MRVTIVGTGYVGLITGACLADFGHLVTCVDREKERVARLNEGRIPIYEPGLAAIVERNAKAGRLFFVTEIAPAVTSADVVMLAVGTPARRGDGLADVSFVMEAAGEVAASLRDDGVVVTKSTVPVGTGDDVEALIRRRR